MIWPRSAKSEADNVSNSWYMPFSREMGRPGTCTATIGQ
jgi:hypothetical protein